MPEHKNIIFAYLNLLEEDATLQTQSVAFKSLRERERGRESEGQVYQLGEQLHVLHYSLELDLTSKYYFICKLKKHNLKSKI